MILTCEDCKYTQEHWRLKEKFDPITQKSKYYCPKCKKLIFPKRNNKQKTLF